MMSYPRVLQFSIVFFFALLTAACSSGSGGSPYQDVVADGDAGGEADQTTLSVTITSPNAAKIDTTDQTMTLGGTAESPEGVTAVSWESDHGHEGGANGTASWSVSDVPLELGANTITVTATDASGQTRSDKVVINRESESAGSVTLEWLPPTQRTDGTPLENLAGYKIRYGRMSEVYDYTITIDNPGLAAYVVENLVPGDWYFAIAAYDANGLESDLSNEVLLGVN